MMQHRFSMPTGLVLRARCRCLPSLSLWLTNYYHFNDSHRLYCLVEEPIDYLACEGHHRKLLQTTKRPRLRENL